MMHQQMQSAVHPEDDKAQRFYDSVAAVLKEGKVRTKDMGGSANTLDMAKAVAEKL